MCYLDEPCGSEVGIVKGGTEVTFNYCVRYRWCIVDSYWVLGAAFYSYMLLGAVSQHNRSGAVWV